MYIVFEGIDGTGKSTQLELVRERLELMLKKDYYDTKVKTISEPDITDCKNRDDDIEMAFRFALQRHLLLKPIRCMLSDVHPNIVISDRSYYSSVAYQSYLRDFNIPWLFELNSNVPKPQLIFFFDNGDPEDEKLKLIRKQYFMVLPLSTIYVDTKNHSISETTDFIVKSILENYSFLREKYG